MKGGSLGPILDRSKEAYACLYLPSDPRPGAELALTGRWSHDLLAALLNSRSGWVRQEPPAPALSYWRAQQSPLEVGSPAQGLLLASSGRPGALEQMMVRRLAALPGPVERAREQEPQVGPFLADAVLYACLPSLGAGAEGGAGGLPLRGLWLAVRREQNQYELGVLAALARAPADDPEEGPAPDASALANLVRLALASQLRKAHIPGVAARLRATQIEVGAEELTVRGLRLSEAELLALLRDGLGAEGADARGGD